MLPAAAARHVWVDVQDDGSDINATVSLVMTELEVG